MAVAGGPNIVEDGLVLALDAANVKSYPGSGTVWSDQSGLSNDCTLYNGPTFESSSIVFDGIDDYAQIEIPEIQGQATLTVDAVINWRGNTGKMFFGFATYDVFTSGGNLGYNNGASNNVGISAATASLYVNKFTHYTFVMNSSGLMSQNKIYINGVDQGALTALVNADGNGRAFPSTMSLAIWNSLGGWIGDVTYGSVKVYTRELTAQEVEQNYNATKGRFGL